MSFVSRAVTFAALVMVSGCGDNRALPPLPSAPSSQLSGDLTIRSITPAPGATLTVTECTVAGSGFKYMCASQLQITSDVRLSHDIPDAVLTVSFYSDKGRCGTLSSGAFSLTAGATTSISGSGVDFSTEAGDLECQLPVTTTTMRIGLWARNDPATPLLTREVPGTFTFRLP